MPRYAIAKERRPCCQGYLARATRISDAHGAARQGVTEMRRVKVPLMTHTRRKSAAKNPQCTVLMKHFAHRLALPARRDWVGQFISYSR